ncbi:MAG: AAA family ATPase [Chloroflexi bacterium]|nr:AAA family ATPase [Chloroflexota bacterium]
MSRSPLLNSCIGKGAYDGAQRRPKPDAQIKDKYAKEHTIVIDECSMLTMNDLAAILNVLDLGQVKHIILVGDPNQLPPIGVGRPFADICASLEAASESSDAETRKIADALGRLTIEVRTIQTGQPSDLLKLASWFTREQQPVDADDILSKLESNLPLNDLEYHFWQEPEQLYEKLFNLFQQHFGLENSEDYKGFNRARHEWGVWELSREFPNLVSSTNGTAWRLCSKPSHSKAVSR